MNLLQVRVLTNVERLFAIVMLSATVTGVAAQAAESNSRVALARSSSFRVALGDKQIESIWCREVMRQALLLSARAEFGLATSDEVLGEVVSPDDLNVLELNCSTEKENHLRLHRGKQGERTQVWSVAFPSEVKGVRQKAWIVRMEELSRTGFSDALIKCGWQKKPLRRSKQATAPLDPLLAAMIDDDLTFESQFLAIRRLHEVLAEDGETRARMAGLVRAYANLGLLTEQNWHPMSQVFKARSVLYAQRWVTRDPRSVAALQHRAYAFALIGMHGPALADLEAAEKLAAVVTPRPEPPSWLPLIEPFCKFELDELKRLRTELKNQQLASLLCFVAFEQEGSRDLTLKIGLSLSEDFPGCYRINDSLCAFSGPGAGQTITMAGPLHLARTLLPRLATLTELPQDVRDAVDDARAAGALASEDEAVEDLEAEVKHRPKIVAALRAPPRREAGKSTPTANLSEPSWSVLGTIVEETSFLQAFRLAHFYGKQIGLPADQVLDAYKPTYAEHPYAPLLDVYRKEITDPKFADAAKAAASGDVLLINAALYKTLPVDIRRAIATSADRHLESLPNEFVLINRPPAADRVLRDDVIEPSPYCPSGIDIALMVDQSNAIELRKDWQKVAERSSTLALRYGTSYLNRDSERAEKYLKLAVKLNPSALNCNTLAVHYQKVKNDEGWLEAMKLFLETPELGLEHAQVRVSISKHYRQKHEWEKALPYAEAAAESYAQWALHESRDLHEAFQDFEAAEAEYTGCLSRYKEHPLNYYFFCKRNGVGDVEAARKLAFPDGVVEFAVASDLQPEVIGLSLHLEGFDKRAIEYYRQVAAQSRIMRNLSYDMMAAICADAADAPETRDTIISEILKTPKPPPAPVPDVIPPAPSYYEALEKIAFYRTEIAELARQLQSDLASGGGCKLDFGKLEESCAAAKPDQQAIFYYCLGSYCNQHGNREKGVEYWKRAMRDPDVHSKTRTAAGDALTKAGVKAGDWKNYLLEKPATQKTDTPAAK